MLSTPGTWFLKTIALQQVVPIALLVLLRRVASTFLQFNIPDGVFWAIVLLSPLLGYIGRKYIATIHHSWRAKALGAVLIPEWRGWLPGNVDILAMILNMVKIEYPADAFLMATGKMGPIFSLRLMWVQQVFTNQPEHIKAILATDFANFEKGERFNAMMHSVLGSGVFNADGDMWKFHRSMTRPFFSRDRISHFDIFERHADEAIKLMKARLREGCAVDFQDLVSKFTLDSATSFLFGSCADSLKTGLPYPHNFSPAKKSQQQDITSSDLSDFSRAFSEAQLGISKRARLGVLWPLWEIAGDRTKDAMKVVDRVLDPILRDGLERAKSRVNDGDAKEATDDDEGTLLDHLVRFTDDKKVLKDEILNIMLAGRDTTASTLTFAMYLLALHPDVLARLRTEILGTVGPTRRPTYDDIREMKYLRAVINETLRLFPPVPFNIRESVNETTFAPLHPGEKPFYIPPKTFMTYSVILMHRRTDLWGPDALEYDPSRFLDERLHKYLTPNPFIFLPFNAGPRICLGQQFAYNETSFMLIRLLQQFDKVEMCEEAGGGVPGHWKDLNIGGRHRVEKVHPRVHLTMYVVDGLWIKMREASSFGDDAS